MAEPRKPFSFKTILNQPSEEPEVTSVDHGRGLMIEIIKSPNIRGEVLYDDFGAIAAVNTILDILRDNPNPDTNKEPFLGVLLNDELDPSDFAKLMRIASKILLLEKK